MMLLVDLGNSRVKWATLDHGHLGVQHAAAHAGWSARDWQQALFIAPGIERVVAASVAGGPSAAALAEAGRAATGRPVEFVATQRECAGVRNVYPEPRLLGVDRWLAVIAAHRLAGGACCVADIGTAATVDAVDGSGQHLGGFIVPGPDLMMRSLWRGTADLASHTATSGASNAALFADNTRDAIQRGCQLAVASLVDRSVAEVRRQLDETPAVVLTGGGAAALEPLLESPAMVVADLVLQGLALVAAGPAAPETQVENHHP
jgi:type III pantothenate kinase